MRTLLHFAEHGDTSGFFPQLAQRHDRSRYRMLFGTLKPIVPSLREYMDSQGVPTFSCDAPSRAAYPAALARMVAYLRREHVEILHTHLFDPSVVGLVAGVLAGVPCRVLTRHHSDYHTRIDRPWHVRMDKLCTRLAHVVIAVSHHTADHLVLVEGAPPTKVRAIPNGIDFERVHVSSPDAPIRLRRELAADGRALLLIAARLHPEKGYDVLFDALPLVRAKTSVPFRLLVAGTGPLEAVYRRHVEARGCSDVVSFLGFRRDIVDLMAAADLLVLPSRAEAFGLAAVEGLHIGVPVIASSAGGLREILEDGRDGLLVPPGDAAALAEAIAGLLNDPSARQRLAGAGRGKVAERYRFEDMVRAYEAVYAELETRVLPHA